jgi:DNA-binding NarL/FixJ family response regulator
MPGFLTLIKDVPDKELPLTKREKIVLENLSRGLQYKEIAEELNISFQTVKCHITNIYTKLKVNNRSEAMIRYISYLNDN